MRSAILHSLVELKVPEALDEGSLSLTQLASRLQADPKRLARLLRAATELGVLQTVQRSAAAEPSYRHTAASRVLSRSHPSSVASLVRFTFAGLADMCDSKG